MKVGDLVIMKDARYHKEIGVVVKTIGSWRLKIYWSDGFFMWEKDISIKAVKKCP
tara:strand:+ start:2568 stop:2732 length:165 start_codon:yes stop_codon:yes gene_type:complete